jgi:calcineurin-like phosphoesterase family protein
MTRVFVTSDTHFGHANIIKYCNRPFDSVSEMDESLIQRWNTRVGVADTVYFLGDFGMCSDDRKLEILSQLNGDIKFIMGNHDKKYRSCSSMKDLLLGEVLDNIHYMSHEGKDFVMCHYPIEDWPDGAIMLHGHVHTQFGSVLEKNKYDVGVDMYGGPVELTNLDSPQGWDDHDRTN